MFHKVQLRLTLLFTGITTLILIVMSLLYILISTQNLRNNTFLSFQSDIGTLLTTLDTQPVLSYNQLAKLEGNGKYIIAQYDNGYPVSYNFITKDEATLNTIKEAELYWKKMLLVPPIALIPTPVMNFPLLILPGKSTTCVRQSC